MLHLKREDIKNEKLFGSINLFPFLTSPVCNPKSSGERTANRKKGLHDLLNLTPLPLSVMLPGHIGNSVAIESFCLAMGWGHMTNFFPHNFSSYVWFLHMLGESRRQRRYLGSKLRLLPICFIYFYSRDFKDFMLGKIQCNLLKKNLHHSNFL